MATDNSATVAPPVVTEHDPAALVWVAMKSDNGPEYSLRGLFCTREKALAAMGGVIHPGAGRLRSAGGVGWRLPDGTQVWREEIDGGLTTEDAFIQSWEVS